jgi:N-dimethylarginine dimethylaminohydrolase
MNHYGTSDEYSTLRTLIMCPPDNFEIRKPINIVQKKWHKLGLGPDPVKRRQQYENVKKTLIHEGIKIWEIPPSKIYTYQVFTRDAGVITDKGALIANFKLDPRRGEQEEFVQMLKVKKINIGYNFKSPATFEGGDFVFLNSENIFLGIGDRTNPEAYEIFSHILSSKTIHPIQLAKDYLHLDVVLNVVSPEIAVAYLPALSGETISLLEKMHFRIIEVSEQEQETMATNVLSIGKNKIISASCNPVTNNRLRQNGLNVIEIDMSEILKGGGGLRCMTLPVLRN